jgi:hypothetical protein
MVVVGVILVMARQKIASSVTIGMLQKKKVNAPFLQFKAVAVVLALAVVVVVVAAKAGSAVAIERGDGVVVIFVLAVK